MKAWPAGFQAPSQTLHRWRVSFADGAVRVVWAADPLLVGRMATLVYAGSVVDVEVMG